MCISPRNLHPHVFQLWLNALDVCTSFKGNIISYVRPNTFSTYFVTVAKYARKAGDADVIY